MLETPSHSAIRQGRGAEQFALAVQHIDQGPGTHLETGLGRLQRALGRDLSSLERPYPADRGQDAPIAVTHLLPNRASGLLQDVLCGTVLMTGLPGRCLYAATGIQGKAQLDTNDSVVGVDAFICVGT